MSRYQRSQEYVALKRLEKLQRRRKKEHKEDKASPSKLHHSDSDMEEIDLNPVISEEKVAKRTLDLVESDSNLEVSTSKGRFQRSRINFEKHRKQSLRDIFKSRSQHLPVTEKDIKVDYANKTPEKKIAKSTKQTTFNDAPSTSRIYGKNSTRILRMVDNVLSLGKKKSDHDNKMRH